MSRTLADLRHGTGRGVALARESDAGRRAASLYGSTLVTAALGFGYWAVAARLADDASAVGAAGAAIATMQLVGTLATLGLGSLIIARHARRWRLGFALVGAALRITTAAAWSAASSSGWS